MFWRIALYLVVSLLQAALYKPPPGPKSATLDDFNIPKAKEGDPIYDFAGTTWIEDAHVAAYGDFRSVAIYKKNGKK